MAHEHFDVAILGEGLAGTTVAARLAASQRDWRVCVVEPRTDLPTDRTWCFWNTADTGWEGHAVKRWSAWSVRHAGVTTRSQSERYRYHCLPSEQFFAASRGALGSNQRVRTFRGIRATHIALGPADALTVHTSAGPLTADWVLDSRPLPRAEQQQWVAGELLQHFAGWHVETEVDAFDPDTVTLMDFDVPQADGEIHFEYVLPFSTRDALVEATYFSLNTHTDAAYEAALRDYLEARFQLTDGDYRIRRREQGVIPMSRRPAPQTDHPRWVRIGTPGGLVKPSTGYAFGAVQDWTGRFVARLEAGRTTPPAARSKVQTWMDRVFLAVLHAHPARAPELFARLFQNVSPDAVVRFLTDQGTVRDALAVVRAMPKLPFLRQLLGQFPSGTPARWSPATTSEVMS